VPQDRTHELRLRVGRAAGVFAVTGTLFYRENLARAMRRALAAGVPPDEVIALSVLPRDEAEQLLAAAAS
jgi:hypothetical protein